MRNTFTFGGVTSSTHGVFISGQGVFNAPPRQYNMISVPGREGDLVGVEKRFANIDVKYPAFISANFKTNMAGIRNALLAQVGYQELTDTYHPDEYRLAVYKGGLDADVRTRNDAATFDIVFNCKPQRFLTSGKTVTTVTSGSSLNNPTLFASKPVIKVTGYGQLTVNSDVITIANTFAYVTIDCELMDCYHDTDNANEQVSFSSNDFPVLRPGTNTFSFTNTITNVEVTPRWWRI